MINTLLYLTGCLLEVYITRYITEKQNVRFDVNKPNDVRKMTSPLNVGQDIFIDTFLDWKHKYQFSLHYCTIMHDLYHSNAL